MHVWQKESTQTFEIQSDTCTLEGDEIRLASDKYLILEMIIHVAP